MIKDDNKHLKGTFRKKPVIVEAIQFREKNISAVQDFCGNKLIFDSETNAYRIITLEGHSYPLQEDDWIIEGINGEFYPCKPDIFEKTYEEVEKPKGEVEENAL